MAHECMTRVGREYRYNLCEHAHKHGLQLGSTAKVDEPLCFLTAQVMDDAWGEAVFVELHTMLRGLYRFLLQQVGPFDDTRSCRNHA